MTQWDSILAEHFQIHEKLVLKYQETQYLATPINFVISSRIDFFSLMDALIIEFRLVPIYEKAIKQKFLRIFKNNNSALLF